MSSTRTPVSEKRLAANRANALKSTGPRTPEGKIRSSRNSVKHGFRSSSFAVVRLEDLNEIADLKADAVACYKPVNAQELFAVERIALAQQMILRAARLEAGLFTSALNEALDPCDDRPFTPMAAEMVGDGDIEVTRAQNRNYGLAEGFRKLSRESDTWRLFLRYQAQAERMYRRAIEDFDRLKALRECTNDHPDRLCVQTEDSLPNEPNLEPQPEPADPLIPLEELNPNCRTQPASTPTTPPLSRLPDSRPQPLPVTRLTEHPTP